MTLKPTWPPKPPVKSPESQESMILPLHSSPSLSPSPQFQAPAKTKHVLKLPVIRQGVIKMSYEEACRGPMDIENYYADENVSFCIVYINYVVTVMFTLK